MAKEINELTNLARRQIAGEKVNNEAILVRAAFRRINKLSEQHGDDQLQAWLRAVTDMYRYRVRSLVNGVDAKELSPEVACWMSFTRTRSRICARR